MPGVTVWFLGAIFGSLIFPDAFNRAIDIAFPIYTLLAVILIVRLGRNRDAATTTTRRVYNYVKKSKMENLTWKQKLMGKWEKIERVGFIDFLVFMGKIPAWTASTMERVIESKPFFNVMQFEDSTETKVKLDTLGVPEVYGPYIPVNGEPIEFTHENEFGIEKMWWVEEEQSLYRTRENPKAKVLTTQIRKFVDDNTMNLVSTTRKLDSGAENVVTVKFRRVD